MDTHELNEKILAIALPAIVSNITTPLLGLVDIAIIGHVGGSEYIAAIGVGASLFSMVYMLFGFLRMGTAGITAQCYGAYDKDACSATLRRALITAALSALTIFILAVPFGRMALHFLDADNESAAAAWRYCSIVIFGAPAVLGMYVLNGWLLGMQNTRLPMWIALVINTGNIVLSFSLVYFFGMKIEGIATGTLCSQWTGFIVCLAAVKIKYRPPHIKYKEILAAKELVRLLRINADIFLRNVCMIVVTTWFTRAGALQSDTILAANTVLLQFFFFFSYFSDGFANAGEALAGSCIGGGEKPLLRKVVRGVLQWAAWIAFVFTVLYFLLGEVVLRLLTDDLGVIFTAVDYLPWAMSVPLCGFSAFIFDGIFVGLTRTRSMLISVAAGAAVFIAVYLLTRHSMGNHGVWLAFVSYLAVRGGTLAVIFWKTRT